MQAAKLCKAGGCKTVQGRHGGLGYCSRHYKRFKEYGDAYSDIPFGKGALPRRREEIILLKQGRHRCQLCSRILPVSRFWKCSACPVGIASVCKRCGRMRAMSIYRKRTYGITGKQYEFILKKQGNACAICGNENGGNVKRGRKQKRKLSVDHEHKTGHVRGLLCCRCNFLIGWFDNIDGFREKLITHLQRRWDFTNISDH